MENQNLNSKSYLLLRKTLKNLCAMSFVCFMLFGSLLFGHIDNYKDYSHTTSEYAQIRQTINLYFCFSLVSIFTCLALLITIFTKDKED